MKKRLLWASAVLAVLAIAVIGRIYWLHIAPLNIYESNPTYQSFVIRLYSDPSEKVDGYWRKELKYKDDEFTLELGSQKIPTQSGRSAIYTSGSLTGPYAFKIVSEMAPQGKYKEFRKSHEAYFNELTDKEFDVRKWKTADGDEIWLAKSTVEPEEDYSGTIALGQAFFPEKSIISTLYFFNTAAYKQPLPPMELILEQLAKNVRTGYNN